jgi:hypothetical protein
MGTIQTTNNSSNATSSPTVQRRPDIKRNISTAGTIMAGKKSILIINTGGKEGKVLGDLLYSGESLSLEATGSDTIGQIDYDATGTTFTIATLT